MNLILRLSIDIAEKEAVQEDNREDRRHIHNLNTSVETKQDVGVASLKPSSAATLTFALLVDSFRPFHLRYKVMRLRRDPSA